LNGYLSVAAPAIVNILTLIAMARGQAVNPAVVAKVQADAKNVQALVQSVESATQGNIPTACSALNVAIQTFAADLPTLEQIGQISNPTMLIQIQDGVTLAQSTISALESPIAACQSAPAAQRSELVLAAASRVKSPSDFVSQYNKIMAREAATKKLKIHIHSKFMRTVSFGALK
jgi:hypothetical protein